MVRFALAVAVAILLVDQLSKAWLIELLMARSAGLELTPFFNLVMVWNPGVSFGLFGAADLGPWPFVALGGLIVVGLAVWLWRVENRLLGIAIGAVIGGAIGNMVDRVRYGAVADFFDFHLMGYHWPAFNVADSAIVVGVGAIVASPTRRPDERSRRDWNCANEEIVCDPDGGAPGAAARTFGLWCLGRDLRHERQAGT